MPSLLVIGHPHQLVLVREVHNRGLRSVASGTTLGRLTGAIELHLAVELALNTIIADAADPPATKRLRAARERWSDLWDVADEVFQSCSDNPLPAFKHLDRLRELRNAAQHSGAAPDREVLRSYIAPVRTLLTTIFADAYGANFDSFVAFDLIPNDSIRARFAAATASFESGELYRAVVVLKSLRRQMLDAVYHYLHSNSATRPLYVTPNSEVFRSRSQQDLGEVFRNLERAIQAEFRQVRREHIVAGLGLSPDQQYEFNRLTRHINGSETLTGKLNVVTTGGRVSKDEVKEAFPALLDYVVSLTLRLAETYPAAIRSISLRPLMADS